MRWSIFAALALAGILGFIVLTGCESSPDAPTFNNPFDPGSDTGGDALQVSASTSDTTIIITWQQPQGYNIAEYSIRRASHPDSTFIQIATQVATTAPQAQYVWRTPEATATNWFLVQAITTAGDVSLTSYAVPAVAITGPRVVLGSGTKKPASRYNDLSVTVTTGDSLRIIRTSAFAVDTVHVAAEAPDVPLVIPDFDLGPADANGDTIRVQVIAYTGAAVSVPTVLVMTVDFSPNFKVTPVSSTVATQLVDLFIPTSGVEMMRFAHSQGELDIAPWMAATDTLKGFLLKDTASSQNVWGEFQGNFGFNDKSSITVIPDLLTSATFAVDLPNDRITDQSSVLLLSDAVATQMRVSESPDFTTVGWQAYADSLWFDLSPGEGNKPLYAQFRNDWAETGILTDFVIYVYQALSVAFIAPGEGDIVLGGTSLQVLGNSAAGNGIASVDSVKIDRGDGLGFVGVSGTDNWSYNWAVPRFVEDTDLILRARAWVLINANTDSAYTDSTTAVVNVTVSQLSLTINDPVDGSSVGSGSGLSIAGTAVGVLGGAGLDSVIVDVGAERLKASGTSNWSTIWSMPLVAADSLVTIKATVFAGGESFGDSVGVTLTP